VTDDARQHSSQEIDTDADKARSWPGESARSIDFIATLPTASLCLHCLLWRRQIGKSYDSCQSCAVARTASTKRRNSPTAARPGKGIFLIV